MPTTSSGANSSVLVVPNEGEYCKDLKKHGPIFDV